MVRLPAPFAHMETGVRCDSTTTVSEAVEVGLGRLRSMASSSESHAGRAAAMKGSTSGQPEPEQELQVQFALPVRISTKGGLRCKQCGAMMSLDEVCVVTDIVSAAPINTRLPLIPR